VEAAHHVRALGPRIVVVKKGEHGALLFGEKDEVFAVPALPMREVVDPTGAGDSFAGGFMGYIAREDSTRFETLKQAVVHGSVMASFTCEAFGPAGLSRAGEREIAERYGLFRSLTGF
jgi:sugar/nucleoside kinase (ribokinase family)